MFENLKYSA